MTHCCKRPIESIQCFVGPTSFASFSSQSFAEVALVIVSMVVNVLRKKERKKETPYISGLILI